MVPCVGVGGCFWFCSMLLWCACMSFRGDHKAIGPLGHKIFEVQLVCRPWHHLAGRTCHALDVHKTCFRRFVWSTSRLLFPLRFSFFPAFILPKTQKPKAHSSPLFPS